MITRRRFFGFSALISGLAIVPAWLTNFFVRKQSPAPPDAPNHLFKLMGKNSVYYQTPDLLGSDRYMRRLEMLTPHMVYFDVGYGKDKGKWFLLNMDTKQYVLNPATAEVERHGLNDELFQSITNTENKDFHGKVLRFDPKLFEIPAGFRKVTSI